MKDIKIDTEYIKLDQFLKLTGVAATGGHAKILIKEGNVEVNGQVNTMRGKKLKKNDTIKIENNNFKVI